jgi:hypothetical protein
MSFEFVDVIRLCQWLTVKGKCQYEGNTDIESKRTKQSSGDKPGGKESVDDGPSGDLA